MASELVALNSAWLDFGTVTAASGMVTGTTKTDCAAYYSGTYWNPYPWYITTTATHRPIRLTLPEVERLRLAAKRDAKLKAVLAKFTDQIEVEVAFE